MIDTIEKLQTPLADDCQCRMFADEGHSPSMVPGGLPEMW